MQVDALGKFLDRIPIDTDNIVLDNSWNTCTVTWKNNEDIIEVNMNGTSLGIFKGDYAAEQYIGFRGGVFTAIVDNVLITETSGEKHFSTFNWYESCNRNAIILECLVICTKITFFIAIGIAIIYLFTRNMRIASSITLSCCFTVILVLWPWTIYRISVLAPRYPLESDTMRKKEHIRVEKSIMHRRDEMTHEYPASYPFPENTVVLIGSSQTWGSGAALRKHTWANKLENILNEEYAPLKVLVMNTAIKAAKSEELYPYYEEFLGQYPHKLLVMVLGCNDRNEEVLRENLIRFINFARKKKVKPALVIEAFSYEDQASGSGMRSTMESIANEYKVPLFNLHEAVEAYQDAGFFWWDRVHPTSFGHECVAHLLAPFFRECLDAQYR